MQTDELKATLEAHGVDVKGAMNRMMNNENLFVRLMKKMRDDTSYAKLEAALAEKDYKAAYEAAHTLKGAAGNLGLNPIYQTAGLMSDKLKVDNTDGVEEDFKALSAAYEDIFSILRTIE